MKRLAMVSGLLVLAAMTGWGAPGRTFMQAPAAGDTRNRRPEFRWTAAADATQYLLDVTRNGTPYLQKWTRKTQWTPRFDFPEGVFEARIIAYDGAEYGQWSTRVRFRRVFTPSISVLNGLTGDGAAITLAAGDGIAIEPVASNKTIVIRSTGITATQIVSMAITTEKIDDRAVTYDKLADNAVYGDKIADDGVTSNKLADQAVQTRALADGAVTTPKLADGSVTSSKLADGAAQTRHLADAAVTTAKLVDGSVTSNKIATGGVSLSNLESGGAANQNTLVYNSGKWLPGVLYVGYAERSIGTSPEALAAGAIAIGNGNSCSAVDAALLGGSYNSIGSEASSAVIVGGGNNSIVSNSIYSSIVGGRYNQISKNFCFASGLRARATNEGSFVWADSSGGGVGSWGTNTVVFMASGGVRFQSATPGTANHRVEWKPGDGGWSFSSDRNLKEGIEAVDAQEVLGRMASVPVARWRFKGSERVHIGVMAQDFRAAFPLPGSEETLLDSADLHGVTMAAIQGLNEQLKAEQARNAALEVRLKALEQRLGE